MLGKTLLEPSAVKAARGGRQQPSKHKWTAVRSCGSGQAEGERTGSPKARATQCLLLEVVAVPGLGGSAVALEMRREAAGLTAARQRLTFPLSGMDKCEPGDFCRCVGRGEAPL